MKTDSIDDIFEDVSVNKDGPTYHHDLFWIILWIMISFSSRIWGDLLYRFMDNVFGKRRTTEQLIAMTLISILIIFMFVRIYDFDIDRS